jgi:hypothetical protein
MLALQKAPLEKPRLSLSVGLHNLHETDVTPYISHCRDKVSQGSYSISGKKERKEKVLACQVRTTPCPLSLSNQVPKRHFNSDI